MLNAKPAANDALQEPEITEIDDELSEFDTSEDAANEETAYDDGAYGDAVLETDIDDEFDADAGDNLPEAESIASHSDACRGDIRRALEERLEAKRMSADLDYLDFD